MADERGCNAALHYLLSRTIDMARLAGVSRTGKPMDSSLDLHASQETHNMLQVFINIYVIFAIFS